MRCPDCNRFVSQEAGEPEVDDSTSDMQVSLSVRIVQNCAECGTELKEATLEIERDLDEEVGEAHSTDTTHALEDGTAISTDDLQTARDITAVLFALLTDLGRDDIETRVEEEIAKFEVEHDLEVEVNLEADSWSKGKGRYCETFYGVSGTIECACSCGFKHTIDILVENPDAHVAASGMDECC